MNNELPRRFLVKVALNLYYTHYLNYPNYGGEIDEFDEKETTGDMKLDTFCKAFLQLYYSKNVDLFQNQISIIATKENKRILFFKLCCN